MRRRPFLLAPSAARQRPCAGPVAAGRGGCPPYAWSYALFGIDPSRLKQMGVHVGGLLAQYDRRVTRLVWECTFDLGGLVEGTGPL
jgi:hypothetical protein